MLVHEKGRNALVAKEGSSIRNMIHKKGNTEADLQIQESMLTTFPQRNSEPKFSEILASQNLTPYHRLSIAGTGNFKNNAVFDTPHNYQASMKIQQNIDLMRRKNKGTQIWNCKIK